MPLLYKCIYLLERVVVVREAFLVAALICMSGKGATIKGEWYYKWVSKAMKPKASEGGWTKVEYFHHTTDNYKERNKSRECVRKKNILLCTMSPPAPNSCHPGLITVAKFYPERKVRHVAKPISELANKASSSPQTQFPLGMNHQPGS